MKFALFCAFAALTGFVAAAPVESELMREARAVYKRHFPDANLSKRNEDGSICDEDILNFALQLEYLEAQFYQIAAYGKQLPDDILNGVGTRGKVCQGDATAVPFKSDLARQYAKEIADDEYAHVLALRGALGSAAVAMPDIDLVDSFTAAANAAGITNGTFTPFDNDDDFFLGAFLFEDVGVSAYSGAAPLISSKDYLAAAAGILAVEAYHGAAIRANLIAAAQENAAIFKAANLAAAAEGSLDDKKTTPLQNEDGSVNVVAADSNAIAWSRTPGQVLDIVYLTGNKGATFGGFFPSGLNGKLNVAVGAGN